MYRVEQKGNRLDKGKKENRNVKKVSGYAVGKKLCLGTSVWKKSVPPVHRAMDNILSMLFTYYCRCYEVKSKDGCLLLFGLLWEAVKMFCADCAEHQKKQGCNHEIVD